MSDDAKTRELVKSAYPSKKWAQRVDKMTQDQVNAIYIRLRAQNKIRL